MAKAGALSYQPDSLTSLSSSRIPGLRSKPLRGSRGTRRAAALDSRLCGNDKWRFYLNANRSSLADGIAPKLQVRGIDGPGCNCAPTAVRHRLINIKVP